MCDSKKEDGLLSVEEAAEYLGVDLSQVYRIIQSGRLPATMVEVERVVVVKRKKKVPRVSQDDLERYKKGRWQNKRS